MGQLINKRVTIRDNCKTGTGRARQVTLGFTSLPLLQSYTMRLHPTYSIVCTYSAK